MRVVIIVMHINEIATRTRRTRIDRVHLANSVIWRTTKLIRAHTSLWICIWRRFFENFAERRIHELTWIVNTNGQTLVRLLLLVTIIVIARILRSLLSRWRIGRRRARRSRKVRGTTYRV